MKSSVLLAPLFLIGCLDSGDSQDQPDDPVPPGTSEDGCSPIFAQDQVPEYRVELSASEWAALNDEFVRRNERTAAGLDPAPYHPAELRYGVAGQVGEPVPGVLVRLKGASSWLQTVDLDQNPKMQFVIAFNEVDPKGRFHGVRKVELDMPRTDQTFLHQRLALSFMRSAGVSAQCANSARLYLNGTYYGLYTHLERLDKEFIQRHFGADDDGDLWKSGREIKTNEETFTWDRLDALWGVTDLAQLDALADLDASMYEWAAEAMIGDADGFYNGRANFYLYDHPTRGFVWLPHDMDTALDQDFLAADASPVFPVALARWEGDWHHYVLAMNDPAGQARYVSALNDVRGRYDARALHQRLDQWSAQIASAAAEDPRKPFSMDAHRIAVSRTHDFVSARAQYIDAWLTCRASGGGADSDGDGVDMCHDCNDRDGTVRPGAREVCNQRDDNCDGVADRLGGASVCE